MKKLMWLLTGWVAVLAAVFLVNAVSVWRDSADERARGAFAIPQGAAVDAASLRGAVLRRFPVGTPDAAVAEALMGPSAAGDSLTRYFPPTPEGRAYLRIGGGARLLGFLRRSYAVDLSFGADHRLRDVTVRARIGTPWPALVPEV